MTTEKEDYCPIHGNIFKPNECAYCKKITKKEGFKKFPRLHPEAIKRINWNYITDIEKWRVDTAEKLEKIDAKINQDFDNIDEAFHYLFAKWKELLESVK